MYSGDDNEISDLVFGVGPVTFNYTFELKVQIVDKYGAKAEKDLEIEVNIHVQGFQLLGISWREKHRARSARTYEWDPGPPSAYRSPGGVQEQSP